MAFWAGRLAGTARPDRTGSRFDGVASLQSFQGILEAKAPIRESVQRHPKPPSDVLTKALLVLDHLVQHLQVGIASTQDSVNVLDELIRKGLGLRRRLSAGLGAELLRLL